MFRRAIALLMVAGVVGLAHGQQSANEIIEPENGWWFNPAETGYGLNIELQRDQLFVGVFVYDELGSPIWYNAFGAYDAVSGVFTGDLVEFQDGPCLSCSFTSASATGVIPSTITLTFFGLADGRVEWAGRTFDIQRFDPARSGDPLNYLVGQFMVAVPLSPEGGSIGNLINISSTRAAEGGQTFLQGLDANGNFAVASFVDENTFLIGLSRQDNSLEAYVLQPTGLNAVRFDQAFYQRFGVDGQPTSEPVPAAAVRLLQTPVEVEPVGLNQTKRQGASADLLRAMRAVIATLQAQ